MPSVRAKPGAPAIAADDPALAPAKPRRNRQQDLVDAAIRLFAERGYGGTSMRDIAEAVNILPGSIYSHYKSKEDLLDAVFDKVRSTYQTKFQSIYTEGDDPWARLEAACVAHVEALILSPGVAAILAIFLNPGDSAPYEHVVAFREDHDRVFRDLIDAIPDTDIADRKYFRLALLGALNHAQVWYRPGGESPAEVARGLLRVFSAGRAAKTANPPAP